MKLRRLHIHHRTTYRYSAPVKFGVHRMVLRPREGHRITVARHELATEPASILTWMTDVHGNHVAYAEIPEPSDRLVISNEIDLELLEDDPEGLPPARLPQSTLPLTFLQTEQPLVEAYRTPVWPDEAPRIAAWAAALEGVDAARTAVGTAQWLCRAVHRQIAYRRREEPGTQSPATTLHLGTGSCRDMATLLMEAARCLGIPARFVSGYLDSAVSSAGRGSTHAWAEAYFPDAGWRGFDPTSGHATGPRHIATGVSSHPRGVMPVSGTFDGRAGTCLGLAVELTIRRGTLPPGVPGAPAAVSREIP